MPKISKILVDKAFPQKSDFFIWDSGLPGFGLRIHPSGRKTYLIQYRREGRTRRFKIGLHGVFTPDQARQRAKILLGKVADGQDPSGARDEARRNITVDALCDWYLREGVGFKKASTVYTDNGRIERHIKPLLGTRQVKSLEKQDIERFLRDVAEGRTKQDIRTRSRGRSIVRGGSGTATRTTGLLGAILSFAVKQGVRKDNPVHGVPRFPGRNLERYLTAAEMMRLGSALAKVEAEGGNAIAVNLIRLLALTGCRKGELEGLRWEHVDFENAFLRLPDSKTGQKSVPLGTAAVDLLRRVPKVGGNPFVFPGSGGDRSYGTPKVWHRVRREAGLGGLRLHDLRHNFASVGASTGSSLYVLGKILGHKDQKTTQRYAHLAEAPVKVTADSISARIAEAMAGENGKSG